MKSTWERDLENMITSNWNDEMDNLIELTSEAPVHVKTKRNGDTLVAISSVISCYDIETSSFYKGVEYKVIQDHKGNYKMFIEDLSILQDVEKNSIVYNHNIRFRFNDREFERTRDDIIFNFRHNSDFFKFMVELHRKSIRKIVVWVQNLSFEYQFMRRYLNFHTGFSVGKIRDLVKATLSPDENEWYEYSGIEFRDSCCLSGKSLAKMGEDLGIPKSTDLEYRLIRTPLTKIERYEWKYILIDTEIGVNWISMTLKNHGDNLVTIPMTKTGFVRRTVRGAVMKNKEHVIILNLAKNDNLETYHMLNSCYQGGYTHASYYHMGEIKKKVAAFDEASAYTGVMTQYQYPLTTFVAIEDESAENVMNIIDEKCVIMTATFENIKTKSGFPYFSKSKCGNLIGEEVDNGRIYSAEFLSIDITDVDLRTAIDNYNFDRVTFSNVMTSERGYLPTAFVNQALEFYILKTILKGDKDNDFEYKMAKENNNSIYGMTVTALIRELMMFNEDTNMMEFVIDESTSEVDEIISQMEQLSKNEKQKFINYQWGVYIPAYARYALFKLIHALENAGVDTYYCDTDSVYFDHCEIAMKIVEEQNNTILTRMRAAEEHHGFDNGYTAPENSEGVPYQLGVWEFEGVYDEFKTLGAKRYLTKKDGEFELTCSGLNKGASKYIAEHGGFDFFDDGMYIPARDENDKIVSGRNISAYLDEKMTGVVTDYLGQEYHYEQLSGIHIEESGFTLSISDEYESFIENFSRLHDLTNRTNTIL